jgi:Domain of unknown function (DUF4386)
MVPIMFALALLQFLDGRLVLHFLPVVRNGTPPGFYVKFVLLILMIVGVALSLWSKQCSPTGLVIMEPIRGASPRLRARIAGIFYLLEMLTGGFAIFIGGRLFVSGDAAATATNILAHQSLFEFAFAANLIQFACYIAVTGLFYDLFKPVNRGLSLLAAFFSLVGCTVGAVSCLFQLAPLVVLGGVPYLNAFTVEQLQALALMFLKLYAQCFNISFVFFGFYCLLIGYLIFRSSFLPRMVGAGMVLAGFGWLTFLSPALTHHLSPYILAVGIGEGLLTLWLLVAGVNAERWKEQAGAAGVSIRT